MQIEKKHRTSHLRVRAALKFSLMRGSAIANSIMLSCSHFIGRNWSCSLVVSTSAVFREFYLVQNVQASMQQDSDACTKVILRPQFFIFLFLTNACSFFSSLFNCNSLTEILKTHWCTIENVYLMKFVDLRSKKNELRSELDTSSSRAWPINNHDRSLQPSLMLKNKALVRSKIFAAFALTLSRRSCARAQNVLSAAQFCAHSKIPKSFQST